MRLRAVFDSKGLIGIAYYFKPLRTIGSRSRDLFSYTVKAEENQWKFVGDEEFPLATAKVDTMAELNPPCCL